MTEKFKILAKYIKDISSETPDIETYFFVKENNFIDGEFEDIEDNDDRKI